MVGAIGAVGPVQAHRPSALLTMVGECVHLVASPPLRSRSLF